jgi:hypothetical protein
MLSYTIQIMNDANMTTLIEHLDTLEGGNKVVERSTDVKGEGKGASTSTSVSRSVINETNVIFFILVAITLYPGTIGMMENIQIIRTLSRSPLFFLVQTLAIVVLWIVISRLYHEE